MHYAIIAAGEGSRLRQEGADLPKPLIPVMGQPMLGRLISLFDAMGVESISVICNEQSPQVADFLSRLSTRIPVLRYVVQSTPSSMHSLAVLSQIIPEGRFCLTTVDTVFRTSDFRTFIQACIRMGSADGCFAVTPFVDDEKPLWVAVQPDDARSRIIGFYDQECLMPAQSPRLVSGGIYCLDTRTAFPVLQACIAQGQSRMRNFQRALLAAGLCIDACIIPRIMDVDHLSDVAKAEQWLAAEELLADGKTSGS